jgi:hypothetical protein
MATYTLVPALKTGVVACTKEPEPEKQGFNQVRLEQVPVKKPIWKAAILFPAPLSHDILLMLITEVPVAATLY